MPTTRATKGAGVARAATTTASAPNVELDDETAAALIRQLHRVQGQIGGIVRMLESGRECREVVQQISAATRGLHQTGFRLLTHVLEDCISEERAGHRSRHSREELEKMFLQLS